MSTYKWSEEDEILLDIYNRYRFYFRDDLIFVDMVDIDKEFLPGAEVTEASLTQYLNQQGFCASPEHFQKVDAQEAIFLLEWKTTFTEFSNAQKTPSAQVAYIKEKVLELMGPIRFGFTNAEISEYNEASTASILCTLPEGNYDFQSMVVALVSGSKVFVLVTFCIN